MLKLIQIVHRLKLYEIHGQDSRQNVPERTVPQVPLNIAFANQSCRWQALRSVLKMQREKALGFVRQ
jgi:hypothetical protein